MNMNEILAITVVLTTIFAYINYRWVKWPTTIGIMALSLISSVMFFVLGDFNSFLSGKATALVSAIDFRDVLLNFMLSFLLFAAAIHVDATKLKNERLTITILATVGVLISAFLIGGMIWYLFILFHFNIRFIYCTLFGALISPTDPIAVVGILKEAKIPASLEAKISGESLFNDGIAVVIFISIAELARTGDFSFIDIGKLFLREAIGGLLFGFLIGRLGYWALQSIDDYKLELLITLAIVTGGYFIAGALHVSGPLAMVVAGIIIGNKVKQHGMSEQTRDHLDKFWEMIDEILNAILFLLIGFEMLIIKLSTIVFIVGIISILIALIARWISVLLPLYLLRYKVKLERYAVPILTWGGLRGGVSVALALSLDETMYRDEFVLITYIIVIFSILVQGLTIGKISKKLLAKV